MIINGVAYLYPLFNSKVLMLNSIDSTLSISSP
uniref:Uncharacterized protein n=1 Tax=Tetranychus urticae TaxID=32264 RepID=T1KY70_TETUR